jgi:UPF0271 protein
MVIEEIRNEIARIRALNWSETEKLMIMMPEEASIKHIMDQANTMGEASSLSETDRRVLALTYQLTQLGDDITLVSDDYSVQNLADELGLKYAGMSTRGIKRRFHWIQYCPGCREQFKQSQQERVCLICGTELKRKPVKKSERRSER